MYLAFLLFSAAVLSVIGFPAPAPYLRCGPDFGDTVCDNELCCSAAGYCGTGPDYCAVPEECLPNYGICDSEAIVPGKSTSTDPRPLLGHVSYNDDIRHCTKPRVIALTYDDGPSTNTPKLLDLLKQRNAKATFFIAGNNNGKGEIDDDRSGYPPLLKRMLNEGHQIASHTFSHFRLPDLTPEARKTDIYKNERAIANVIGKYPTYMRPPYGACDGACAADMANLGYHRIQEDLDSMDWAYPQPAQLAMPKEIIDAFFADQPAHVNVLSSQHDPLPSVFELTGYILDHVEALGWDSVTVGECLGDEEGNWYRMAE